MQWHALKEVEVFKELETSEKGLSEFEFQERLSKYGPNVISKEKKTSEFIIFLKQFHNPLIYVLFVATLISFTFKHFIDAYIILAVLLMNACISYFQERKTKRTLDALKKLIVSYAKVLRGNELIKIPSTELVPGDIIFLEEGDKVPADARLIEIKNFRTQESSLTGESFPSEKNLKQLPEKISLGDKTNMVFMGTFVVSGTAKAIVVGTGNETEIGKVAVSIKEVIAPRMHFNEKVKQLTFLLGGLAFLGSFLVFLVGYFISGLEFFDIFLFTIASLVSGIPEGLPTVLVIVLAVGASRMAKRNAVIRHLPAVETLGVASVIATDKTGTLTMNTLNVQEIITSSGKIDVAGDGWDSSGKFFKEGKEFNPAEDAELKKILEISVLSNRSNVVRDNKQKTNPEKNEDETYKIIGDPTEAALLILAKRGNITKEKILSDGKIKIVDDLAFSSDFKFRATLIEKKSEEGTKKELLAIGAFEKMLDLSSSIFKNGRKIVLEKEMKNKIMDEARTLARQGTRVLGIAFKSVSSKTESAHPEIVEDMTFLGLIGMKDPPRPSVKDAIQRARNAGVRVIMQTGDHEETALSIAKEIGLVDESATKELVLTELELEKLSEEEFKKAVKEISVFARVTPKMKMKVVQTLQEQGEIVAMTGDGVNDAPALKGADIGISMGIIGTDVARESSEMVLTDDNFSSIVNAIEEGRIVFRNVRQTSTYLITTSFSEYFTIITSMALKMPLPLLPIHILWVNVFTGSLSGFSIALEPSHNTALDQKPRRKEENIINKDVVPFFFIIAPIMVIGTLMTFIYLNQNFGLEKAMTGAFVMMTFCELFNLINMRSLNKSVFKIGFSKNKFVILSLAFSVIGTLALIYIPVLSQIFRFEPLSILELLAITAFASLVFFAGEIYKGIRNARS